MPATAQEYAERRATREAIINANLAAEQELAELFGLEESIVPRCNGCETPLGPKRGRGGPSRKWCSERCRQRMGVRTNSAFFMLRDPCAYCGGPADAFDHIEPSSQGGSVDWTNLAGVCGLCNTQKGNRDLLRFLLARPLFEGIAQAKAELALLRRAA